MTKGGGSIRANLCRAHDRLAFINLKWAIQDVVPGRGRWDAEGVVYGCGEVLGSLRITGREAADPVRGSDDHAARNSAAGEKHGLNRLPMIPPRQLVVFRQRRD